MKKDNEEILKLKQQIESSEEKITDVSTELKDEIFDKYTSVVNNSQVIISNGLSSQGQMLAIFSIIIAIIIGVGTRYISKRGEDLEKIRKQTENLKKEISKREEEVKKLRDQSKGFWEKLEKEPQKVYQKIVDEETEFIFKRLSIVPEDIINLFTKIAIRKNLPTKYQKLLFKIFKEEEDEKYRFPSFMLLLQFFTRKTLETEKLFNFIDSRVISCCHKHELVCILKELIILCQEKPEEYKNKTEKIVGYIKRSRPKRSNEELYQKLENLLEKKFYKERWKEKEKKSTPQPSPQSTSKPHPSPAS